ncbi:hypothetical protein [Saccharopolyspora dendranthemae]|uniref:Outer membrane channel protein CpnT-like N-terminal domain-containing protein n=1 Tax=Saccharopolyspora dendranthemae TaxID=1181886 RepID=A0A561U1D9_9PSEU|nr:hypothetical protein [Saccharopolyspora dendranthemae]TWF93140.1 hypothetical protein FHU35_16423 [Saccharopolyspora dendranthemae]
MSNPLVAQQPESNDGFITKGTGDAGWATGIGIAESVNDVSSLNEGSNWVESGLAYGGLAMEAVSAAVDPIGTLLSYGLSWLIEHVQPLKEALDWFAGDPDGVEAYGKTWENVSKAVSEAAEQYNAAVKADTADWTGAAGDAYRKTAAEKGEALTGAAQLAGTISSVVTIMGEVVSFVREFVRDLVADCVSRLITYALEAVLPPIASLAWVIPQAVAFISKTVTKIVDIVTKLTKTISNVSPKLAKLAEVFGDIMKTLGNMGKATAGGLGKVADKLDVAEHLAKKTWQKVDDTFGTDVVGRRNARMGGPDAPDGADSPADSEPGGGSGGSSSASESGGSGSSGASGSSSPGDAQSSVRSESAGGSSGSRSDPGSGDSSPSGRTEAEPGTSGGRTDAGSGSQPHGDAGQSSGGSSRTDADSGSGSGGSTNSDAGSQARADSPSDSGSQARTESSADPGSGTQARTDSSPGSGSDARPDVSPDPGGQARSESSSSAGTQSDSGTSGQSQSSGSGSGGAGSGGAGTHTSDVPREPAHTSAAGVEAPAKPPETAAPQSSPAPPRPDQPSGAAPTGGANAPGSSSAPGGRTPSPRGGRQGGQAGWTGSSGLPGAARDLPSHAPRTPRSPSHPPSPRPNGPGPAHPHAPRGGSPMPTRAPHAPAPMRSARPDAPHTPSRPGTPVQRQQVAPPRPEQLRTADSPRTPIPAQRTPEAPNSLPEQPRPDAPKISTADSMAAETPPKDQWQAGHHMVEHTPRLDISPELRNKLGSSLRDIEATGAGLSFTKPPVKDYFGRADWAHKRPRCSVDPNRFTVEMHGSPDGVKFKGNQLDAKELAEIIRGSSGYKDGTPIRLVSCETGADVPDGSKNFAQQLSEELGVEVLAPNTNAWVDNYGNIYANESSAKFDKNEPGTPKPRLDSPGEWTAFRPDGTKAVHSSPYPPGHQPEWVRHGIQAEGARMRGLFGRKDEDFSTDPVTGHNYSNAPPQGHGPPQGQYGPPQGQFGPPQGNYGPPQGHYGPPQGQFGPPQGQFGPPQGNYGPPQGNYGPPQGQFGPPQGNYGPPQGQHGPAQGQHGPPQQHFPPQGNVPQGQHFVPQGQHPGPQGQNLGPQAQHFPQQANVPPGQHFPQQGNVPSQPQNVGPPNQGLSQQAPHPQSGPNQAYSAPPSHSQHGYPNPGHPPQSHPQPNGPKPTTSAAPHAHLPQNNPQGVHGSHPPQVQHGPGQAGYAQPPHPGQLQGVPQSSYSPPNQQTHGPSAQAPQKGPSAPQPQSPVSNPGPSASSPAAPGNPAQHGPGPQASQHQAMPQGAHPQPSSPNSALKPPVQASPTAHPGSPVPQSAGKPQATPAHSSPQPQPQHQPTTQPKLSQQPGPASPPPKSPDLEPGAQKPGSAQAVGQSAPNSPSQPKVNGQDTSPKGGDFEELAPSGTAEPNVHPEQADVSSPGTPKLDDFEPKGAPASSPSHVGKSGSGQSEPSAMTDGGPSVGHGPKLDDFEPKANSPVPASHTGPPPPKLSFDQMLNGTDTGVPDAPDAHPHEPAGGEEFSRPAPNVPEHGVDPPNPESLTNGDPDGPPRGNPDFVASREDQEAFLEHARNNWQFTLSTPQELQELRAKLSPRLDAMSDAEIDAIRTYTRDNGDTYRRLNEALRNGQADGYEPYRRTLTSALNKLRAANIEAGLGPIPGQKLLRGMSLDPKALEQFRSDHQPGGAVEHKGFMSTAYGRDGFAGNVTMEIYGHSFTDIRDLSRLDEGEFLGIDGVRFMVTELRDKPDGGVHVVMEEITEHSTIRASAGDVDMNSERSAFDKILNGLDG